MKSGRGSFDSTNATLASRRGRRKENRSGMGPRRVERFLGAPWIALTLFGIAACGESNRVVSAPTHTPSPVPATATPAPCPLPPPFCGGDFPLNTQDTTPYGPPWANVLLQNTDFLPCFGPYALCYYANCTVGPDGASACPCFEWYGTNYVDINSILNLDSYLATTAACATPGACSQPNSAPVCGDLISGSFLPSAKRFSTFSLYRAKAEPIGSTACTDPSARSPYAGCMTAPCFGPTMPGPDPHTATITCDCPIFDGPYQIGMDVDPQQCDDRPKAWSAAYNPNPPPSNPCDLVPGGCIPDAPPDECGCPLFDPGHTTLPPGSGVDCSTVCQEYASCTRSDLALGFTCDATLCTSTDHDLVFDACLGLENCDLSEIFKAESAASCSCCGSQLCNCAANDPTNVKIGQLNASERADGDVPQCDINGTLCGTPPP